MADRTYRTLGTERLLPTRRQATCLDRSGGSTKSDGNPNSRRISVGEKRRKPVSVSR